LLVMLAGFLVARFVGQALAGPSANTTTLHVVLLDDSLSMQDRAPKNQNPGPNCFAVALQQIEALADNASRAPSGQQLIVMTMRKGEVVFNEKLTDDSLGRLRDALKNLKPTAMHADALTAVERGKEKLNT